MPNFRKAIDPNYKGKRDSRYRSEVTILETIGGFTATVAVVRNRKDKDVVLTRSYPVKQENDSEGYRCRLIVWIWGRMLAICGEKNYKYPKWVYHGQTKEPTPAEFPELFAEAEKGASQWYQW